MSRHALAVLLLLAACGGSSAPGADAEPSPDGPALSAIIGRDELVDACVRIAACVPNPAVVPRLSYCSNTRENVRAPLTAAFRCVNAAGADCNAVLACLAGDAPVETCSDTPIVTCADDTHLRGCFAATTYTWACDPGVTCTTTNLGSKCGDEVCPVPCTASEYCRATGTGGFCEAMDAECLASDISGSRIECDRCNDEGFDQGVVHTTHFDVCVGSSRECLNTSFDDRCHDTSIEYCKDGRIVAIDCQALGFHGCNAGDPADPDHRATCGGTL